MWLLAAVTLLALVLRVIALDSDLWLDELTPIRAYRDASAWQVMLVKWDTSTRWAQRLEEVGIVRPLRRRLRYENPGSPRGWSGATFASALVFPDRDWTKELR